MGLWIKKQALLVCYNIIFFIQNHQKNKICKRPISLKSLKIKRSPCKSIFSSSKTVKNTIVEIPHFVFSKTSKKIQALYIEIHIFLFPKSLNSLNIMFQNHQKMFVSPKCSNAQKPEKSRHFLFQDQNYTIRDLFFSKIKKNKILQILKPSETCTILQSHYCF